MRRLYGLLALSLILALAACAAPGARAAAPARYDAETQKTAAYLARAENPVPGDAGDDWAVIGLARGGYYPGKAYFDGYISAVRADAADGGLDYRTGTSYARCVLALTAAGCDARGIAGHDLTAPLGDYAFVCRQGINGPVWALLALDAGGYPVPPAPAGAAQATRKSYIDYILAREVKGGGFALSGSVPDPDVTAMALQALSKYRYRADVDGAVSRAITALSSIQLGSGGFKSMGVENAESCAQVIIALCELSISPDDARFTKSGRTVLDALMAYSMGDGAFRHVPGGASSRVAAEQAYLALASAQRAQGGILSLYRMAGADAAFTDIHGDPNREAIEALCAAGIITGMGDGTYAPHKRMTRAEFAALTVRAVGLAPKAVSVFRDVPAVEWYAKYIGAAYLSGIIKGRSAAVFDPSGYITDVEADIMLSRAAVLLGVAQSSTEAWRSSQNYIDRSAVARRLYDLMRTGGLI